MSDGDLEFTFSAVQHPTTGFKTQEDRSGSESDSPRSTFSFPPEPIIISTETPFLLNQLNQLEENHVQVFDKINGMIY